MLIRCNMPIPVNVTQQISNSDWDEVYRADRHAMPSQSRIWSRAIASSGRFKDVSRLYHFADDSRALLPLFTQKYVPGPLSVLRSPPAAWGFGGLLSTAALTAEQVSSVMYDCAQLPCAAIQVRPNPLQDKVWSEAAAISGWADVSRNAHVLDLSGGFDEVWRNRFPGKTRSKIRRAQKAGVVVRSGNGDKLVADFDGLFRRSVERWARRQNEFSWLAKARARFRDPKEKFISMARQAESLLRIWIAYIDDTPTAGIVVLMGRNAHYTRGAMDERFISNTYANYLLQSMAIEAACGAGCEHYHMGETGGSSALAQFKSSFGASATLYSEYLHERIPLLSADRKLRSFAKSMIGFRDA